MPRAGYEMSFAGDGDEALLIAAEKLPDLILLDMMLPKMSGQEVLKALKKEPATAAIPVVALTGLSQTNAEQLLRDGAFAFLTKSALAPDQGGGGEMKNVSYPAIRFGSCGAPPQRSGSETPAYAPIDTRVSGLSKRLSRPVTIWRWRKN